MVACLAHLFPLLVFARGIHPTIHEADGPGLIIYWLFIYDIGVNIEGLQTLL